MAKDFYSDPKQYRKLTAGKPLTETDLLLVVVGETLSGKTAMVNGLEFPLVTYGHWIGSTVPRIAVDYPMVNTLVRVLDLPGEHGTNIHDIEELVRQDHRLDKAKVAILFVTNGNSLARTLPFLLELSELNVPLLVGLREQQKAQLEGSLPDIETMRTILDIPIITDIGDRVLKIEEIAKQALERSAPSFIVRYNRSIENSLQQVTPMLQYNTSRWLALAGVQGMQVTIPDDAQIKVTQENLSWRDSGVDISEIITCTRMQIAQGILDEANPNRYKPSKLGESIGAALTSPSLGLPVILAVTYLMLHLMLGVAQPWVIWINKVAAILASTLGTYSLPDFLHSYLSRALIQGLGGFLALTPLMFAVYLTVCLLEDSGLLSRLGVSFRSLCRLLGISELAINPLFQSMGCIIRGISSSKLLPTPSNQVRSALAMTFVPCVGRLSVLACLAVIFFPDQAALVLISIYLGGFALALLTLLFSKRIEQKILDMESVQGELNLPPCRLPQLSGSIRTAAICTWNFLLTSFVPVLIAVTAIWALVFVKKLDAVCGLFAWIFKPLGLGDPRMVGTILAGLFAKEATLGSTSLCFLVNDPCQTLNLSQSFKALGAISLDAVLGTCHAVLDYFSWASLQSCANDVPVTLASKLTMIFKPAQGIALLVFTTFCPSCVAIWSDLVRLVGGKYMMCIIAIQFVVAWILALICGQLI